MFSRPARTLTYPVEGATHEPNATLGDWVLAWGVRDASGKLVAAGAQVASAGGPPLRHSRVDRHDEVRVVDDDQAR